MFEKEAEDKALENYPIPQDGDWIDLVINSKYKEGFKDGAEFGYNKANEWHDLRKNPNDLPEKMGCGSKEVYISYIDGTTDFACYRFDKERWERSEDEEIVTNVIAWTEIPTFKEIKEKLSEVEK